jgi:hypothetical protein
MELPVAGAGRTAAVELLSVLSGAGFEAVEVVTAELDRLTELEVDILDGLTSLVDKSLLRRADAERVGHGWQCWRPSVSTRPKRWTMRPSSALPPVEPTPPNF